jgi:hypothetical protein
VLALFASLFAKTLPWAIFVVSGWSSLQWIIATLEGKKL